MEGDLIKRMEKHRDVIGHVQVAGVPDRAEPDDDNEVNFAAIFRALERIGYGGLVGLEYKPRGDTVAGLKLDAGAGAALKSIATSGRPAAAARTGRQPQPGAADDRTSARTRH